MKFIYLADTHFGGQDNYGYRQQNRYLCHRQELIRHLNDWIEADGGIDFILHGGDMAEAGTRENIELSSELFASIRIPVYLALGNHDLTEPDSLPAWLRSAPRFFPGGSVNFTVKHGPVELDVLSVHWSSVPYLWKAEEPQIPYFDTEQSAQLERDSGSIRVVVSHAPPCGMPASQCGMEKELHPPEGNFSGIIRDFARRRNPVLFLGAHTHMNLSVREGKSHLVTVSAFTETPFEFKVFEIGDDSSTGMKTVNLASEVSFPTRYDFDKTYVQGRPCDRSFSGPSS